RHLAELLGVGRGTMSRQVTRLERIGLLTRTADPHDSRSQPLTLTEEGARRLAHARSGRQQYLRDSLAAWRVEELTHLAELLARLNDDLVQDGERSAGPG
ncbi:MarR family winged helix-turn-helix transcriptional regulator, partial [Cellulomonas avistercoris]